MDVRRSQIVWSSDSPCKRYSTGAPAGPAALPVMPIWERVCCGRITVIDVLRESDSAKKSQLIKAMRPSCQDRTAARAGQSSIERRSTEERADVRAETGTRKARQH